jgi:CRISPR system Cascade subunit CasA
MPASEDDGPSVANATGTYLGRLVPLSRAIRLADDCRTLTLANGLKYPSYSKGGWREPTATVVVRTRGGEETREVLKASGEKAPWRELAAVVVKAVSQGEPGGPAALHNIREDSDFDLWVGTLLSDRSKLVDTIESVFHVPAGMLAEPCQRCYEKGVRFAEEWGLRLERAVTVYHGALADNLERREMRERRQQIQGKAAAQFWTGLEQAVNWLLDAAARPETLGPDADWKRSRWGQTVLEAVQSAYERACPHQTPRQMRAYAEARRVLFGERAAPDGRSAVKGEG